MPDKDGYPTEEELETIRKWDWIDGDIRKLLDHVEECWWEPEWGFCLTGKRVLRLELHTGGWSGNEEIIGVLQDTMFWTLYWERSKRGGHYIFKIPPLKRGSP